MNKSFQKRGWEVDKPPKRQHAHKVVDYFLLQLALFFPSVAGDNWFNWIHLGVLLDETVKVVCSVFALTLDVLLVVLADTQPPDISHQYAKRFGEGLFSTHQTGNLQICQIGILPFFSQPSYGRHWKIQGSTVPSIVSTGEIFLVLLMKGWRSKHCANKNGLKEHQDPRFNIFPNTISWKMPVS